MDYNTYLIVHIGGASISGLAEILIGSGKKVYGWEKRIQNENVQKLIKEGVEVFSGEIPIDIIDSIDCVVHSSITSSEFIRNFFGFGNKTHIFTQFKFINQLIRHAKSIAITGSYGKTITTILLSHVLDNNQFDISFTCGGISKNFSSNAKIGKSNIWIVEAVETHENCLHLSYSYGIILNIESPNQIHVFESFIKNAKDKVFINSDDTYSKNILAKHPNNIITFGIKELISDFRAINITYLGNSLAFDVIWKYKTVGRINIPYNGFFSIYNVLAVTVASIYLGLNTDQLNKSFSTFMGVFKRFDTVYNSPKVSLLVDIAHHPVSIKEVIKESQKIYNEIIVLYHPHMFKELNQDVTATIDAFSKADKVVLLEIESIKDKLENGINAEEFVNQQKEKGKKWFFFHQNIKLLDWLTNIQYSNTVIIQMGMYIDSELTSQIVSLFQRN